jgi:hypothetical protein
MDARPAILERPAPAEQRIGATKAKLADVPLYPVIFIIGG